MQSGRHNPRRFTLLEVVVALAILGLSMGLYLQQVGGARERLFRAENRWMNQHALAQAGEFYLLAGTEDAMPDGVLPGGYSAACTAAPADNLPDTAVDGISGWILGRYTISVTGSDGRTAGEMTVERVVREDDAGK